MLKLRIRFPHDIDFDDVEYDKAFRKLFKKIHNREPDEIGDWKDNPMRIEALQHNISSLLFRDLFIVGTPIITIVEDNSDATPSD